MKPHVQPRSRRGIGPKKGDYKRCSACIVGGVIVDPKSNVPDHRPRFVCTRCGHAFTNRKNGEPYFSALRGFALPPGWGISGEMYLREDGMFVLQCGSAWCYGGDDVGYETPLVAMRAADEASR